MSASTAPRRPFLITLLGVLGVIQAVFAIPFGIALAVEHDDADLLRHADVSSDTLLSVGIAAIVVGVVTLIVALGLLRGAEWARFVLGVLQLFHLGGGLYVLFAYEGAHRWDGVSSIVIALLILWILLSRRSDEFFASR